VKILQGNALRIGLCFLLFFGVYGVQVAAANTGLVAVPEKITDKIISQQRIVQDFEQVSIYGKATVYYMASRDNEFRLEIETASHLLKHVESNVDSGELTIKIKHNSEKKEDIIIYIHAPTLSKITLNGDVFLKTQEGRLRADNFEIKSAGNSLVSMELDVDDFQAHIIGSSNFTLQGRAKEQAITVEGDGVFKGDKLLGDVAEINIYGNGNCNVNVSDSLDVSIKGMGVVSYLGSPTVERDIVGFGLVNAL